MKQPREQLATPIDTDKSLYEQRRNNQTRIMVAYALDQFARATTDNARGIPLTHESIDGFSLYNLPEPHCHKDGYFRAARFSDAVLLRTTTKNSLSDSLHTLILRNPSPVEDELEVSYARKSINVYCQVIGGTRRADSVEAMAEMPRIISALSQIHAAIEVEQLEGWPSAYDARKINRSRKRS